MKIHILKNKISSLQQELIDSNDEIEYQRLQKLLYLNLQIKIEFF